MEKLYTIGFTKLFLETIGNDAAHEYKAFKLEDINVLGTKMDVYFCKNEKGMFVVAGTYRKGAAYKACGHWHSGNSYVDVYFRKNFRTKEEGNEFYKKVKKTGVI